MAWQYVVCLISIFKWCYSENCVENDFNALAKWANELPALIKEDQIKQKQLESVSDFFMMSDKEIR